MTMKKHPFGHVALVAMGAMLTASSAALALTGVPDTLRAPSGVVLAAAGLPQWNIVEICATDSVGGHCRILESEALRALSGGWATLPEPFRITCLGNLNSPYDKSYRLLSQCLEGQALKGFGKNIDDSARTAEKLAQAATTTTDAPAAAAAAATGPGVLPTTSTTDLFKMSESWGKGSEAKAVASPLAAGASSPLPKDEAALPKGFEGQPTVHPLQASPAVQLTVVPQEKIGGALKSLLAEREGWTKGPAVAAAPAPAAPSSASAPPAATTPAAASGDATLPTTSTADLIKAREAWGKGGEAKTVDAPLATGAYSPLPKDEVAPSKGFEGQPTVHPLQASPPAQMTPVAPDKIAAALKALFAEREGWLSPAKPAAAAQPAPASPPPAATPSAAAASAAGGYQILPTTSTAELFKAREAWGQGSAAKSATPKLAAGAKSPLPKNELAPPKGFSGQPKIHPLVATPAPQPTAVPQDKIADAMKKLLAEREGWGTAPSKAATKTAAAPAASSKSAAAADCEAKLKAAAAKGVILFKSSSADIDAKSNATLKALATVAKGCSKGRIRVEGHTDSTGKAEANNVLSQRRAAAVAAYLVKAGVAKDRVEAVGFGADKPVASNDSDEGRAKNRRIEFGVAD